MAGAPPPVGTPIRDEARTQPNSGQYVSEIEIVNAARDAGFRDDEPSGDDYSPARPSSELVVSVAIALCESSGDRTAVGRPSDGSYVIGLWQVKRSTLVKALFDPATNAQAAYALYSGRGNRFSGTWSCFDSKVYRGNLARAENAVKATHRGPLIDIPFGDMAEAVTFFLSWITAGSTWIRLGEALAGALLIGGGLVLLVKTTRTA